MMKRRAFIALLGGAAAVWPFVVRAQQTAMPVVGFLHSASPGPFASAVVAFRQGLSETGFTEGQNVAIEYRWAEGQYDRLPALAADLIRRLVTVIAAIAGNAPAQAAKAATTSIPIVFVSGGDPLSAGLIASLNRPGGNVTGVSWIATVLVTKQLELLRRLARNPAVIGALVNPSYPDHDFQARELQEAGAALGQKINVVWAATEHDIDTAVVSLVQQGAAALMVANDPFFVSRRDQIVAGRPSSTRSTTRSATSGSLWPEASPKRSTGNSPAISTCSIHCPRDSMRQCSSRRRTAPSARVWFTCQRNAAGDYSHCPALRSGADRAAVMI